MQFAYTIIYVENVPATLDFYRRAFGIETGFLHESNDYGELITGTTKLAFAQHETAQGNLKHAYTPLTQSLAGIEIGLTTSDVPAAYQKAIDAGASAITPPSTKPWGQTVAYVRAPEGTLIEICTPIG